MDRKVILKWNKISLVVPEKQDAEFFYKGINNLEIQHYLWYSSRLFSFEYEEKFLEKINNDEKSHTFCIMLNETQQIIWNMWLNEIDHVNKHGTLGIAIFDNEQRGKWYGKEAIELVHHFAKNHLNLRKLCLHVYWDNKNAMKLYSKIWYKEIWRWSKHKFYNWDFVDDVMMEIFL